jgi:hypothetical protein
MEVRAEQSIEKRVARSLVFRRRRFESAVVDGKMAREAELCRNRRNLFDCTTPPETIVSAPLESASCRT